MKVEGEVEARRAFIGKWEIIHIIDKHFQLILELKNSINYRQTILSKWNVFSEIESITEQATTVINLFIFCIENVLRMLFSVFVVNLEKKWHRDNKTPTIQNSTFTIPSIEDGDFYKYIYFFYLLSKVWFWKMYTTFWIGNICRELTVALR